MIEGDLQTFEDMEPLLRLAQVVGGASCHHFFAVIQEGFEGLFEVKYLWTTVDNNEDVDAEGFLQRRVFIELIKDDFRYRVALELDDDAHAVGVLFITEVGDSFNFLLLYQAGNLLDDPVFVHHEWDFADNDLLFPSTLDGFGEGLPTRLNDAFTLVVGLAARLTDALLLVVALDYSFLAVNETAGREIWSRNMLHQLLDRKIRALH